MLIGLMQGRLLPPVRQPIQEFPSARWPEEFPLAAGLGFDAIEFIFDGTPRELAVHPLLEPGLGAIRVQTETTGVRVLSICADYFMRAPLHRNSHAARGERTELLARLVAQAGELGVTDIVLPYVDEASLCGEGDDTALLESLEQVLCVCAREGVRIALEVDLPPAEVRRLMERGANPWLRVNYDAGNSAALGYDPQTEWAAYGSFISSVHIKDRMRGGGTVPLGTGDTAFDRLFRAMRDAGYDGLLTIQGARGVDHAVTAAAYKAFVDALVARHYGEPSHRARTAP